MTTRNGESLGRRIARMRLRHGMTQERLADIANVSAQAVSKWENDQSYPDILLLPLLAKTFGMTVDELLGVEPVAPAPAVAPEVVQETKAPADETEVAAEEPEPTAEAVDATEPLPAQEAEPEQEQGQEQKPAPEQEPAPESEPTPEATPGAKGQIDADGPAVRIRLRVIRNGRDAVNLALPLAAARMLSNVVTYFPDRLIEGIDVIGLAACVENASKGTLIDVDDDNDRVIITLE